MRSCKVEEREEGTRQAVRVRNICAAARGPAMTGRSALIDQAGVSGRICMAGVIRDGEAEWQLLLQKTGGRGALRGGREGDAETKRRPAIIH